MLDSARLKGFTRTSLDTVIVAPQNAFDKIDVRGEVY